MPTLERDDVVIIDNLTAHHVAGVREAIEAAGATRYLPQYSPDPDPIEMALAKGALIQTFRPQGCAAYLRHAGYAAI